MMAEFRRRSFELSGWERQPVLHRPRNVRGIMRLLDSRLWRRMLVLLIAGLITFGTPLALRAQDDAADDPDATADKAAAVPLVIINAASVDRLLGDVKYLFETAGQAQINESIENGLARYD